MPPWRWATTKLNQIMCMILLIFTSLGYFFNAFLGLYAILCAQNHPTTISAAQNNSLLESLYDIWSHLVKNQMLLHCFIINFLGTVYFWHFALKRPKFACQLQAHFFLHIFQLLNVLRLFWVPRYWMTFQSFYINSMKKGSKVPFKWQSVTSSYQTTC